MPELHLRQPGITYSACGPLIKHCERIQKIRETGDSSIYIEMNLIKLVLLMMLHILVVKS